MKANSSKRILLLSLSFFNILFGIFLGITALSIFFFVYDLLSPGYYYKGFYMSLSRMGLEIISPIQGYGNYSIFVSFTSKYFTTLFAFLYSSIFLLAVLYSLIQIKSILKISYEETPFTKRASKALKKIGAVITFTPIIILALWLYLLFREISLSSFSSYFWNHWAPVSFILKIFLYWFYYAILGIFFFALGEVFNRGFQLKLENDLTV